MTPLAMLVSDQLSQDHNPCVLATLILLNDGPKVQTIVTVCRL
jgi:hypothetical protein